MIANYLLLPRIYEIVNLQKHPTLQVLEILYILIFPYG